MQEAYEDFKDCLLSEAACQLASTGNVAQLGELLQLHPHILLPSLLDILSTLPATMPVSAYTPLLQVCLCACVCDQEKCEVVRRAATPVPLTAELDKLSTLPATIPVPAYPPAPGVCAHVSLSRVDNMPLLSSCACIHPLAPGVRAHVRLSRVDRMPLLTSPAAQLAGKLCCQACAGSCMLCSSLGQPSCTMRAC